MNSIIGPHFSATLPFRWQSHVSNPQSSNWEMLRYLLVLADFEQVHTHEALELAQAKQDLLLLWLAKSQTIDLPPLEPVCLGLQQLSWQGTAAIMAGSIGQVQLCLSQEFPLLLTFKAKIVSCQQMTTDRWQIIAELVELDGPLLSQYEQTVFRYHRRAIQQAKQVAA